MATATGAGASVEVEGSPACDTPLLPGDEALVAAPVASFTLAPGKDGRAVDVEVLKWNVNGTCLACGQSNGTANILLTDNTGMRIEKSLASTSTQNAVPIRTATWHTSHERLLFTGGDDCLLRLWDMRKLAIVTKLPLSASVTWCDVSTDGLYAAAGMSDSSAAIVDLRTNKCLHTVAAPAGVRVNCGSWDKEGNLVMVGVQQIEHGLRQGGAWVLSGATMSAQATTEDTLLAHSLACRSAAFDATGALLAVGSLDATVSVWDYAAREVYSILDRPMLSVDALSWSPGSTYLAVASAEAPVEVVRVADGSRVRVVTGTVGARALSWAPSTALLAIASPKPGVLSIVKGPKDL